MAGVFESATKVAIEEIIQKHARKSKFGLILTEESYHELTDDIFGLLVTSRRLKDAGDRMMQTPTVPIRPGSDRSTKLFK